MAVYQLETSHLLDMLELSLAQMRSGDDLEELNGVTVAGMVLGHLRKRVVDTGHIAGNSTGSIDERPGLPRQRRLENLNDALGVRGDTPDSVLTTVAALMDRADAGYLTSGDQDLLNLHTSIAATFVGERTASDTETPLVADALRNIEALQQPYGDQWRDVLLGNPIDLLTALTSLDDRYIQMRRHSPFMRTAHNSRAAR